MKNVLLLTCSTGEGHNSAAHAIENALHNLNINCTVTDPVVFQSEKMKNTVSSLYNNTIKKAPHVFGAVYKLGYYYNETNLPSPVYWANSQYAEKLRGYIEENGFDCVICTHLYGMEAMTYIRKDPEFKIPCFGVMTDYVCIPFMDETELDGFFASNEDAMRTLAEKGCPAEKIFLSGIPVNEKFKNHKDKLSARKELDIPENSKVYLIMTGGTGCENMIGICSEMYSKAGKNGMLLVLTGRNENLKKKLDEKFASADNFITVPFTEKVADYMAAADVLISKSGGLSSTEAAVANVPFVTVHAIPGCETSNAKFFSENGMSVYAQNGREAVRAAYELANDTEKAEKMKKAQRTYINPDAAEFIVRKAEELCG